METGCVVTEAGVWRNGFNSFRSMGVCTVLCNGVVPAGQNAILHSLSFNFYIKIQAASTSQNLKMEKVLIVFQK